jgi:hypothetical protein
MSQISIIGDEGEPVLYASLTSDPILTVVQQITDMGKGEELSRALSEEEIKRKLWSWLSTP